MDAFQPLTAPQALAESLPFEQLIDLLAGAVHVERIQLDNSRWAQVQAIQTRRAAERHSRRMKTAAQLRAERNAELFYGARGAA